MTENSEFINVRKQFEKINSYLTVSFNVYNYSRDVYIIVLKKFIFFKNILSLRSKQNE